KYEEGVKFLSEIGDRVEPELEVATLYWFLEAREQARKVLRAAVAKRFEEAIKSIEAAKRNPKRSREPFAPLEALVGLSGTQLQMNDREGALSTFRRLQTLEHPWFELIRPGLAGRMALANLDAEAFAFVIGGVRDCAALANIAVGQARRGD